MGDSTDTSLVDRIIRFFVDQGAIAQSRKPEIVILTGPPANGKTTIRRADYSLGYVIVDPPELFLLFCNGEIIGFPGPYDEPLTTIGFLIANQAIEERRDIVTEIIDVSDELIDAMTDAGYHVQLIYVQCDLAESWRRNITRGVNNISSYYAQSYNIKWLTLAAQNYKEIHDKARD